MGSRDWVRKFLLPVTTVNPSTLSHARHWRAGSHVSHTPLIWESTRSSSGVTTTIRVTRARSETFSLREKSASFRTILSPSPDNDPQCPVRLFCLRHNFKPIFCRLGQHHLLHVLLLDRLLPVFLVRRQSASGRFLSHPTSLQPCRRCRQRSAQNRYHTLHRFSPQCQQNAFPRVPWMVVSVSTVWPRSTRHCMSTSRCRNFVFKRLKCDMSLLLSGRKRCKFS